MKNIMESAKKIRILVLDVDGVLTDGSLYIGADGEAYKQFNAQDGMGISCALRAGLAVAIITGRRSPSIRRRAEELGITEVCEGIKDKRAALAEVLGRYGFTCGEAAYAGDDLNDLPALTMAGLACAPADAVAEVRERCDFITTAAGGRGAVREIIKLILEAHGAWDGIVASYLKAGQGDAQ